MYICRHVLFLKQRQNNRISLSVVEVSAHVSKVKCILVQALRLCTGRTAHRGIRGIALLFLDHGTRKG